MKSIQFIGVILIVLLISACTAATPPPTATFTVTFSTIPSLTPYITAEPTNTLSPTETPAPTRKDLLDLLDSHGNIEVQEDESIIFIVDDETTLNQEFEMEVKLLENNLLTAKFGDNENKIIIGKVNGEDLEITVDGPDGERFESHKLEDLLVSDQAIFFKDFNNNDSSPYVSLDINQRIKEFRDTHIRASDNFLLSLSKEDLIKYMGRIEYTEKGAETITLLPEYREDWGIVWTHEDEITLVDYNLGNDEMGSARRLRCVYTRQDGGSERVVVLTSTSFKDEENPEITEYRNIEEYEGEKVDYLLDKLASIEESRPYGEFRNIIKNSSMDIVVVFLSFDDKVSGVVETDGKRVKVPYTPQGKILYGGDVRRGKFEVPSFYPSPPLVKWDVITLIQVMENISVGAQTGESYVQGSEKMVPRLMADDDFDDVIYGESLGYGYVALDLND